MSLEITKTAPLTLLKSKFTTITRFQIKFHDFLRITFKIAPIVNLIYVIIMKLTKKVQNLLTDQIDKNVCLQVGYIHMQVSR